MEQGRDDGQASLGGDAAGAAGAVQEPNAVEVAVLDAAIAHACTVNEVEGGTQTRVAIAGLMRAGDWFGAAQALGTGISAAQALFARAQLKAEGEPGPGGPVADVAAATVAALEPAGPASGPLLRGYRALNGDELALIVNRVGEVGRLEELVAELLADQIGCDFGQAGESQFAFQKVFAHLESDRLHVLDFGLGLAAGLLDEEQAVDGGGVVL